jgi:hypothetical protein
MARSKAQVAVGEMSVDELWAFAFRQQGRIATAVRLHEWHRLVGMHEPLFEVLMEIKVRGVQLRLELDDPSVPPMMTRAAALAAISGEIAGARQQPFTRGTR